MTKSNGLPDNIPGTSILRFGNTFVVIDNVMQRVATFLPDGSCVPASPHHDAARSPAYDATAAAHGYAPDAAGRWALCRDHETLHAALATFLDLPESPTLRRVADASTLDPPTSAEATDLTRLEEAAVLAIQAYARALGLDIQKVFRSQKT